MAKKKKERKKQLQTTRMSLSQTKKQKEEFIGTENNRPGEAERRLKNQARNEEKTLEGRKLLKEWNIPNNYVGIGHCILGYADSDLDIATKQRKVDYITYIK